MAVFHLSTLNKGMFSILHSMRKTKKTPYLKNKNLSLLPHHLGTCPAAFTGHLSSWSSAAHLSSLTPHCSAHAPSAVTNVLCPHDFAPLSMFFFCLGPLPTYLLLPPLHTCSSFLYLIPLAFSYIKNCFLSKPHPDPKTRLGASVLYVLSEPLPQWYTRILC